MASSRLAVIVIGVGCVTAAGIGSYLATRQVATSGTAIASPAAVTTEQAPEAPRPAASQVISTNIAEGAAPDAPPAVRREATGSTTRPSTPATSRRTRETRREPEPKPQRPAPISTTASGPASIGSPSAIDEPVLSATENATATPDPVQPLEPLPSAKTTDVRASLPMPEPLEPRFEELVIAADSVIGLQMARSIDSDQARIEDRVEARVIRDVRVAGQVAIPAGTQALGSVTVVDHGGKFRERARLGVRFHTLVLADSTRLPITTETIFRYGEAPGNSSAAKVGGGAVAGAILGAIIGGARGAAIGATSGAGAGAAVVMAGERSAAAFPTGTEMTARILSPVSVTIEK